MIPDFISQTSPRSYEANLFGSLEWHYLEWEKKDEEINHKKKLKEIKKFKVVFIEDDEELDTASFDIRNEMISLLEIDKSSLLKIENEENLMGFFEKNPDLSLAIFLGAGPLRKLKGTHYKLSDLRGEFLSFNECKMTAFFHPKFQLINKNMKESTYRDIEIVKKWIKENS